MIQVSVPRISVVICTYNRCDQLRDTLVSLAQMSVPDSLPWELVVVDNNSSDQTKDVVESFVRESQLNVKYALERSPGLSHARNRGIAESVGGIVSFLDDDVIVAPDWMTEILKAFEQPGVMCVGGRVFLHGDLRIPSWWHNSFNLAVGKFDRGEDVIFYREDDKELIGIGANMSFRRTVFEKYGLFDTEMGRIGTQHRTGEETEMVLRLSRNEELAIYYPGAVVYHCIPVNRFSKQYLRLNSYHYGKWRYISDSESPSKDLRMLGMPLWMYRAIFGAAGAMAWLTLTGQRAEAFVQERRMLVYLGYFAAAQKTKAAPNPAPHP